MMAGNPESRTILDCTLITVFPQFRGDWNGLQLHLEAAHHTGGYWMSLGAKLPPEDKNDGREP